VQCRRQRRGAPTERNSGRCSRRTCRNLTSSGSGSTPPPSSPTCIVIGMLLRRGGCRNRRHSLVKCNHSDPTCIVILRGHERASGRSPSPSCPCLPWPQAHRQPSASAGRGRCVSIFLDKNRRHIGKSQPNGRPKERSTAAAPIIEWCRPQAMYLPPVAHMRTGDPMSRHVGESQPAAGMVPLMSFVWVCDTSTPLPWRTRR
jgi:hypothetical protein